MKAMPFRACLSFRSTRLFGSLQMLRQRVGGSCGRNTSVNSLVMRGAHSPHQELGNVGGDKDDRPITGSPLRPSSVAVHGQHLRSLLHQQPRRNSLPFVVRTGDRVAFETTQSSHRDESSAYSWMQKCKILSMEWTLHPEIFRQLESLWGIPQIDLFATRFNTQLQTFISPYPDDRAAGEDALSLDWNQMCAYAYPPTALIPKILQKISESSAEFF
jgi:hypothetical protein